MGTLSYPFASHEFSLEHANPRAPPIRKNGSHITPWPEHRPTHFEADAGPFVVHFHAPPASEHMRFGAQFNPQMPFRNPNDY